MTERIGKCIGDSAPRFDETYWDHNAAQPVLLIDEATEAITEALYRLRTGSVLADHDLTAAGVALDDLIGGLKQLTELFSTSIGQDAMTDLSDRLQGLQATTRSAQQAADGLHWTRKLRRLASPSEAPTRKLSAVQGAVRDDIVTLFGTVEQKSTPSRSSNGSLAGSTAWSK